MNNTSPTNNNRSVSDLKIDFSIWIQRILSYWWLFALFLALSIAFGQIYLRYSVPLYSSKAKLLMKAVGKSDNLSESQIINSGLGLENLGKDMSNEIEILTSRPILTKVVEKINGDITVFSQGMFKNTELYKDSPIVVDTFSLADNKKRFTFFVKMGYYQDFEFRTSEDSDGTSQTFDVPFRNEHGMFLISQDTTTKLHPGLYKVNLLNPEDVARGYKKSLQVEVVGTKGASGILELNLTDQSPEKGKDFINALIEVYNDEEIEFNTQILTNTIEFIDKRITSLTSELNGIESDIERFKSENDIITQSVSASLDFNLEELRAGLGKLSSYEIEQELLTSLEQVITSQGDELLPVNMVGDNSSLVGLINEYNESILKRKKLLNTASLESPLVIDLTNKIKDSKELILVSIRSLKNDLQVPLSKTKNEINSLQKSLMNVPSVEKKLLEKLRMQTVKESLFLYLLQKREETQLAKAVSTPNTRVIESALSSRRPIYPRHKLVLAGSILFGLFTPLFLIMGLQLFETTVNSEESIKRITNVPIIGRISFYKNKNYIIKSSGERTIRSEMFKLLRANLNFINHDKKNQVIMITSSSTGEGKTVTAINLGLTISFSKKKIVVLDLDLRKPKVTDYLNGTNKLGISNYLTSDIDLSQILNSYEDFEDFAYIGSGPVPPNPSELIMSPKMDVLINKLKEHFDYIIIDTPPLGAVADSLLLRKYITNTLFVVRHKDTKKNALRNMDELYQRGELNNISLVINGIKVSKRSNPYGGYSMTYGSDYYLNENES